MESLIVHPKNQMELSALKSTLKEMGIKFEKFHSRNAPKNPKIAEKIAVKKFEKSAKNLGEKPFKK